MMVTPTKATTVITAAATPAKNIAPKNCVKHHTISNIVMAFSFAADKSNHLPVFMLDRGCLLFDFICRPIGTAGLTGFFAMSPRTVPLGFAGLALLTISTSP
jgi:hypothetical protein